ncbi:MAG TPA: peptidase M61 [Burkholderiaceae bacterium]|jgi:predicted metalloprotease with PDZ domain|nr:peptidase M61 [Burkholderiaceae bacterium]
MTRYRLDVHDAHAHLFRITLTVPQPQAQTVLSLPAWIPGSYLVREFARHLSKIEARQGQRVVPVVQKDKATWVAHCEGAAALTVSYLVYANDPSVRAAFLDARRGFFNGTSVFLRVHGREDQPHRVQIATLPRGWQVGTALAAVDVNEAGRGEYEAANYDELVDHPVELGHFWRGKFKACGVPHEFLVAGALPGFDGERLLADTKRICEAQIALWDAAPPALARRARKSAAPASPKPPYARYVFMLNAVEEGYGGLEHRASTALIAPRRDLPREGLKTLTDGYVQLLGLISHEFFHTWNVKRLRPAEFASFDYTQENYTELLWFFEGFTSYYDDLVLVRAGLIDEARYFKLIAKTINQVLGTPGRHVQSVAASSFDAWVKYYRSDENTPNSTVSYYTKGSLVALALDLTMRGEGRGTLDEVMRSLWRSSQGGPISHADISAALRSVGGRSFERELNAWARGTDDLPLRKLLQTAGVNWTEETAAIAQRLGVRAGDAGGVVKLQSVLRGGAAESAGLAPGDELIALDDWRMKKLDDLVLLGALERDTTLLACRDQRLMRVPLPRLGAVTGNVALATDSAAPRAASQLRAAWLGR